MNKKSRFPAAKSDTPSNDVAGSLSPVVDAPVRFIHPGSDEIEAFEKTGAQFLQDILEMSWSEVFITDLSDLSDFAFRGMPEDGGNSAESLHDLHCVWDEWVISAIQARYRIRLTSTNIRLVDIFRQIEIAASLATIH